MIRIWKIFQKYSQINAMDEKIISFHLYSYISIDEERGVYSILVSQTFIVFWKCYSCCILINIVMSWCYTLLLNSCSSLTKSFPPFEIAVYAPYWNKWLPKLTKYFDLLVKHFEKILHIIYQQNLQRGICQTYQTFIEIGFWKSA